MQNRHHGLALVPLSNVNPQPTLAEHSALLRATPHDIHGHRSGTFELWHRGAREDPLVGFENIHSEGGTTTGIAVLGRAADDRLPLIPITGLTLADCFASVPDLMEVVTQYNLETKILRGRAERTLYRDGSGNYTLIVHPTNVEVYSEFVSNIFLNANDHSIVEFTEINGNGCIITLSVTPDRHPRFTIPHCIAWKENEVRFLPSNRCLNEFGYFYVSLFICGNYARYYPDFWMRDIENNAPLALVTERLIDAAQRRLPLLLLAQLSQTAICLSS